MRKNNTFKRFLAFLLCAAMMITYMPSSVYTLADEDVAAPAVKQEAPAQESAPAETPQVEEEVSEPAPAAEEPAAEEPSETAEEPSGGGKEEADTPSDEPAAVDEQAEEATEAETPEEELTEEEPEQGIKYPEQSFNETVDGVKVYVDAPEGALPEGTTAKFKAVEASEVEDAVKAEMGENAEVVKAVDITFYDKDGKEIEPLKRVSVKFVSREFKKVEETAVVHIDENGEATKVADKFVETEGKNIEFEVKDFSIYVVVDTEVPRLTVKFVNGTTEIASMIIKEADTADEVEKIIYDPGVGTLGEGEIFKGWTNESAYTTSTELKNIAQVRSEAMTQAASITADTTVTYYAAKFKTYTITYQSDDESPITLGTAVAEYPAYESGTPEIAYKVNMGYTVDDKHNFEGWIG